MFPTDDASKVWYTFRFRTDDGITHWREVWGHPGKFVGERMQIGYYCPFPKSNMAVEVVDVLDDSALITCLLCVAQGSLKPPR